MTASTNPLRLVIAAYAAEDPAEGTLRGLARLWNVSPEALYGFERKGYLPLERAKWAAERWPTLSVRDLVSPAIREAMLQA